MWKALIGTARPNFLLLAPLCVSVAIAFSHYLSLTVSTIHIALCIFAALLAHASVNMLNEYHDDKTGLDKMTHRTAFSGGSGTLQQLPEYAEIVKTSGLVLLFVTIIIGSYFVWLRGVELLLLGLVAVASVYFYTPLINRLPVVCLVAPGFGFGITFVTGSFIAISGEYNLGILLLTLPIFLATNNLLLLNQFPDKDADQQNGRRHLIICYGEQKGRTVYLINLILQVISIVCILYWFQFSALGYVLLLPLAAGIFSFYGLGLYLKNKAIDSFKPFLASNVIAALGYPSLLVSLLIIHA